MAQYKGKTERLAAIENISGCKGMGGMANDGNKAWVLKTNSDDTLSTLYYYNDYEKDVTARYQVSNLLGHGNSMTCSPNYLFFGCRSWKDPSSPLSKTILRVPRDFDGNWNKKVKITTPDDIFNLTYYKTHHFIVGRLNFGGFLRFSIGKNTINGSTGTMQYISTFLVRNTSNYGMGQDIFYDTKKNLLFIIRTQQDEDGRLVRNKIMVVNLGSATETYENYPLYTPQDIITVSKQSNTDYKTYEIESLGLDPDRRIVMVCNIYKYSINHYDSFQRITNIQY